jgi:hypothetical protein
MFRTRQEIEFPAELPATRLLPYILTHVRS